MFLTTVIILFIYSVSATPTKDLGGRIVGGEDIPIEKVPYQISLQHLGEHSCGGSIISPNYVITAAHCTEDYEVEDLSIRAGSSIRESGGQVIAVKTINNHPGYAQHAPDYDISVLELVSNLEFGFRVAKISLPAKGQSWPAGTEVLVTGWGLTSERATTLPLYLQGVTVNIVDQDICNRAYGGAISERMVCAGVDGGGKDSCQDDSGGPLQADGFLVGVVSFGAGCAEAGFPGVYAKVEEFLDFIQEITGI